MIMTKTPSQTILVKSWWKERLNLTAKEKKSQDGLRRKNAKGRNARAHKVKREDQEISRKRNVKETNARPQKVKREDEEKNTEGVKRANRNLGEKESDKYLSLKTKVRDKPLIIPHVFPTFSNTHWDLKKLEIFRTSLKESTTAEQLSQKRRGKRMTFPEHWLS